MKKLIILFVFLLFFGCATLTGYKGVCSSEAFYCATVMYDNGFRDVRFVYYDTSFGKHIQAQVKINGEWQWLEKHEDWVVIKDEPQYPVKGEPECISFESGCKLIKLWSRMRRIR